MIRILAPGDERALEEFLLGRLDSSMFLLSNLRAAGLADRGEPYQATWAASFDGERVEAVAAHAWNRALVLQAPVRLPEVVAAAVSASRRPVGGFVGPWAQTEGARAALGLASHPTQYSAREERFVVDLDRLEVPASLGSGSLAFRRARAGDLDVLTRWRADFSVESLGATAGKALDEASREVARRLTAEGTIFVLEVDGEPVCTTAFNAKTPQAVQVGGVYTPSDRRNRGYARAAVAASLLDARREGATRAVLFTGNPAARRCYEAIGFRLVGDYGIVLLSRPVEVEPR